MYILRNKTTRKILQEIYIENNKCEFDYRGDSTPHVSMVGVKSYILDSIYLIHSGIKNKNARDKAIRKLCNLEVWWATWGTHIQKFDVESFVLRNYSVINLLLFEKMWHGFVGDLMFECIDICSEQPETIDQYHIVHSSNAAFGSDICFKLGATVFKEKNTYYLMKVKDLALVKLNFSHMITHSFAVTDLLKCKTHAEADLLIMGKPEPGWIRS
jgi:hypothetical protein